MRDGGPVQAACGFESPQGCHRLIWYEQTFTLVGYEGIPTHQHCPYCDYVCGDHYALLSGISGRRDQGGRGRLTDEALTHVPDDETLGRLDVAELQELWDWMCAASKVWDEPQPVAPPVKPPAHGVRNMVLVLVGALALIVGLLWPGALLIAGVAAVLLLILVGIPGEFFGVAARGWQSQVDAQREQDSRKP